MRRLLLVVACLGAGGAKLRPSAASLRKAQAAFASRLDAQADAALEPLLKAARADRSNTGRRRRVRRRDGPGEEDEEVGEEEERRDATLQSPRSKKRGFEWHDPKRRYGPPPLTLDQRLDAELDEAFKPAVEIDDAESGIEGAVERLRAELGDAPRRTDSRRDSKRERLRRAPERAAAWLQRKFDEVYGEEEEDRD